VISAFLPGIPREQERRLAPQTALNVVRRASCGTAVIGKVGFAFVGPITGRLRVWIQYLGICGYNFVPQFMIVACQQRLDEHAELMLRGIDNGVDVIRGHSSWLGFLTFDALSGR